MTYQSIKLRMIFWETYREIDMRLKNISIVVEHIEKSKVFYHDLFDLIVVKEFRENVILTSGLVIQDKFQWKQLTNESTSVGNASELFFEESGFDAFLCKVQEHAAKVIAKPIVW